MKTLQEASSEELKQASDFTSQLLDRLYECVEVACEQGIRDEITLVAAHTLMFWLAIGEEISKRN